MAQKIIPLLLLLFVFGGNLSCGKEEKIEPKTRTNSPPVIRSLSILPEKPTKESELNSVVQGHDPDNDSVTLHYHWIKNEEEIVGENQNSLKSGNFKKGELIQVKVTPFDGNMNGPAFLSDPVKILNSPPVIQDVWIEPKVAYTTDRLKINVKNSDPDGDFIYCTYQWEKNGLVLDEESGEILEQGRFKKGDSITVTVTPDDRENLGNPKKSEPIVILNSPPIFTSSPTTSVEGTRYVYQVKTNDPDNDPVSFTLKAHPKDMTINNNTGLIQWEIRKENKGDHSVEIEVSDDTGAKSIQRFMLAINFK
jgi:hypothetical protein